MPKGRATEAARGPAQGKGGARGRAQQRWRGAKGHGARSGDRARSGYGVGTLGTPGHGLARPAPKAAHGHKASKLNQNAEEDAEDIYTPEYVVMAQPTHLGASYSDSTLGVALRLEPMPHSTWQFFTQASTDSTTSVV